ncbi:MAG: DUF3822 family protein [Leeuwenhoekiella sp.]
MINDQLHKLSIRVSLDGFSFYIVPDARDNKEEVRAFKMGRTTPAHLLERLRAEMENETLLQGKSFKKISVIHQNPFFSLAPTSYFDAENASSYLQYNTKILKTDFIAHDNIMPHGLVNVYIPFTNINNFVFEKFGEFSYYHHLSVEIDKCLSVASSSGTSVYLNLHTNLMDIIVVNGNSLSLANCFDYETDQDVLYYTLFVMEQLHLDPDDIVVMVDGIEKNTETYALLYKYIRNLVLESPEQAANANPIL